MEFKKAPKGSEMLKLQNAVKSLTSVVTESKNLKLNKEKVKSKGGVEDTTSRPRPRTQKKSEAKAKDQLFEDRPSRGQDRNGRGPGQGSRTQFF